jgi:Mn2+/Fe2+ NRAMP family transporter
MRNIPVHDTGYLYLAAANIGAVIMPWMIFYQQSAIADKRLGPSHYQAARLDTALGAVLTQLVMAAVLVATAATIGRSGTQASLQTVGDLAGALVPFLGPDTGRVVFGLGALGAAMVAAIVVSLAAAWGFGEVTGYKHSLEYRPFEAPWFYGVYAAATLGGAVLVGVTPDLVSLNVGVEVMNALMLPVVLGFLVLLAIKALPPAWRLQGAYLWVVVAVATLTAGLGVYGGLSSLF